MAKLVIDVSNSPPDTRPEASRDRIDTPRRKMNQYLVMIVVESEESSKEQVEKWVKDDIRNLQASFTKASSETVVPLTTPEYSDGEQDYIGDQIAEMQEELAGRKLGADILRKQIAD